MKELLLYFIVFVLVFLMRILLYMIFKKRKKKRQLMTEMQYIINRFKLYKEKVNNIFIAIILSLMDAFIMSITLFLSVKLSNNIVIELLTAFILIIGFIILFNELLGRILKKKGYDKK